jgi:hypothetical protein
MDSFQQTRQACTCDQHQMQQPQNQTLAGISESVRSLGESGTIVFTGQDKEDNSDHHPQKKHQTPLFEDSSISLAFENDEFDNLENLDDIDNFALSRDVDQEHNADNTGEMERDSDEAL